MARWSADSVSVYQGRFHRTLGKILNEKGEDTPKKFPAPAAKPVAKAAAKPLPKAKPAPISGTRPSPELGLCRIPQNSPAPERSARRC